MRSADGSWSPSVLTWGSLFEPHRYPDGAEIGSRLPLPAGRYRIDLDVELLGADRPLLEVRPEGAASGRTYEFARVPGGLSGAFEILTTDAPVSLPVAAARSPWGGSASQPFPEAPV